MKKKNANVTRLFVNDKNFDFNSRFIVVVMIIRNIQATDYSKGYMDVLSQLTMCHKCTFQEFNDALQIIQRDNPTTTILVMEDENKIVGTGKIFIEHKLHNGFKGVAHIEDIVIDQSVRGKGFGHSLMDCLMDIAKKKQCYKVVLNCNLVNENFYEKCGMTKKGTEMCKYLS